MKTIRTISLCTLAALYFACAFAATVNRIEPIYVSSGATNVSQSAGPSKPLPEKSFTQRKHVPLVKPITIPSDVAAVQEFPRHAEKEFAYYNHSENLRSPSFHFLSIGGDRAPPTA